MCCFRAAVALAAPRAPARRVPVVLTWESCWACSHLLCLTLLRMVVVWVCLCAYERVCVIFLLLYGLCICMFVVPVGKLLGVLVPIVLYAVKNGGGVGMNVFMGVYCGFSSSLWVMHMYVCGAGCACSFGCAHALVYI